MTNNNSFITQLTIVTALISVVTSEVFMGRTGNQNQINAVENQLILYPNIETAGVVLNGVALPKSGQLMYRQNGETNWRAGHPLFRIDDGRWSAVYLGFLPSPRTKSKWSVGQLRSAVPSRPWVYLTGK